ncbi:YoaK family protein [Williamsia sp.]|uniref:YoaK family protein n=1 Tax=Williamsia sp. TaxID=1872085 RepID=UPI002F929628
MNTIDRNELALAAALTAVAGFVDAVAFIHLGGYFISFMSGNTTQMSSSFVEGMTSTALRCLSIIGLFVVGVMAGSVIRRIAVGERGRTAVLCSVTTLLGVSAVCAATWSGFVALMVGAVAMGTLNSVFEKSGEVSVGLTYMTGTLVKAAQRLVDAAFGGPRWVWARHFLLWSAMAVGALAGAGAYRELDMSAMWLPFVIVALLTVWATRITAGQKV